MKVWINKHISELENSWEIVATRTLRIVNSTGDHGKRFDHVYLGYKKIARNYYIFINKHRNNQPQVKKTCGIWVDTGDYLVHGNESFSGKTKDRLGTAILGRFGIYEVGTVIENKDGEFVLDENEGWLKLTEE